MNRIGFLVGLALTSTLVALVLLDIPTAVTATSSGGILHFPTTDPTDGTLDPALITYGDSWAIARQIFDGLVQFDQSGNVVPAIASAWSLSPDARTYTFTLRSNVYFHNGRQVKAGDFVYSWNRAKNAGGGYASSFGNISSFTAPSDFSFVVTLLSNQSSFLSMITLPIFGVIPSEAASTIGTQPVGTGPFKFVSWTHGTGGKIVLQANPNYFAGAPYLSGVEYRFYTTGASGQWADFQAGKLDLTQIPTTTWSSVKNDPNVLTQTVMVMMGYGIDNAAFPDIRVRQAFQQAIHRAGIASDPLVWGYDPGVQLAHGVVSPGKPGYDNSDVNLPYNPSNALALLAAAGWTDTNGDHILDNGTGTNLTIVLQGTATSRTIQRLSSDLSNIGGSGVGASITITSNRNAPNLNIRSVGWISDYPDPENDLMPYVTGGLQAARLHYNSAAFNSFYGSGMVNTNPATRNAAFHSADYQVVITDATVIPIYYGAMVPMLKTPVVQSMTFDPVSGYPSAPLENVWLDLKYLYLPMILKQP